ncbi:hypothetical protein Lsan_3650 [Legionella santicrucis]|uniref:Uncharacterized protein n=2 Tax=Legionella santicrucis TaxID=45074 RepID=A0A0W0Y8J3_9GAMM|nr:hypothetical protein Lsan_3650 [Legionella santicrucis]
MHAIKHTSILILLMLLIQAGLLLIMGQPLICVCGYIKLWEGNIASAGNSQHLTDWYTFTHIIHGFIFYFLSWLFFPKTPVSLRLIFAVGVEISWEVIENTPVIIQRYRQQALAAGYSGDSVINSLSDTLSMIMGFGMAWKFPSWFIVLIGLGFELWLAYEIHDNFILNLINLIHESPQIKVWQSTVNLT